MDLKDLGTIAAVVISLVSVSVCYWFYRAGDRRETLRDKQKANDFLMEIAGAAVDKGYCSITEAAEAVALFLTSVDGTEWIYMDRLNMQSLVHEGVWITRQHKAGRRPASEIELDDDFEQLVNRIKGDLWTRKGMIPEVEWVRELN